MRSLHKHYDLNWVIKTYGGDELIVLDSKCNLQPHIQRTSTVIPNAGFLCNMCKAMSYFVGSDWVEGVPFRLNGEKWSLTIEPKKNCAIKHLCSRKGVIMSNAVSYVCGDQYISLKRWNTVTEDLKYSIDLVRAVANYLIKNRAVRMWCDLDVKDLVVVNNRICISNFDKLSLTSSDGRVSPRIDTMQYSYTNGRDSKGYVALPEMQEYYITSLDDFRGRASVDDPTIDYSVIDFYSFIISLCKKGKMDKYLRQLADMMFRKSDMGSISSVEGITIKTNVFDIMKRNGFM